MPHSSQPAPRERHEARQALRSLGIKTPKQARRWLIRHPDSTEDKQAVISAISIVYPRQTITLRES